MRKPIEFEMWVRQPVEAVMAQVEQDAFNALGISPEELDQAVFGWVMGRVSKDGVPQWLEAEIVRLQE